MSLLLTYDDSIEPFSRFFRENQFFREKISLLFWLVYIGSLLNIESNSRYLEIFWRHDVCQSAGVPAVFEDASWLCVWCALPAYPVLQHGQQFVFDTNSLPMLNVSCLTSHALCCAIWSIYRSVPCLLTCIEFCVEDSADARIGVSVLLCQVQSKVYVDASG